MGPTMNTGSMSSKSANAQLVIIMIIMRSYHVTVYCFNISFFLSVSCKIARHSSNVPHVIKAPDHVNYNGLSIFFHE